MANGDRNWLVLTRHRNSIRYGRNLMLLLLNMLAGNAWATQPTVATVHAYYAITAHSSQSSAWHQCLQEIPVFLPDVAWDRVKPRWLLSIDSYLDPETKHGYAAIAVLGVFDHKQVLNRWVQGFPQPLPYSAMNLLEQYIRGLQRLQWHWIERFDPRAPRFCEPIIQTFLQRVAGLKREPESH